MTRGMIQGRRSARRPVAVALPLVLTTVLLHGSQQAGGGVAAPDSAHTQALIVAAYGKLPVTFEPNQGQTDPTVRFLARGPGYTLFLTPTAAVLALRSGTHASPAPRAYPGEGTGEGAVVRMRLLRANPHAKVTGRDALPGKVNYFRGSDPKQWRTNIPTYRKVYYQSIYPGIDLVYYGTPGHLEYDFVVTPGADPTRIRLGFEGAETLSLDGQGDLLLHTGSGRLRVQKPRVYQDGQGGHHPVPARFVVHAPSRQVTFQVAAYDVARPLILDPVLIYSTYLGGSTNDGGNGIAVDGSGNAYVTGSTNSTDFPTASPIQAANAAAPDAFVTKLNPAGSALVYSTYLGGSGTDVGLGIAVDGSGNAYVTGHTDSTDFPTASPIQAANAEGTDAFVIKLNPSGSALVYSTYLGGSKGGLAFLLTGNDMGHAIAVDPIGNAYVTGETSSSDFPTTAGALREAYSVFSEENSLDAFVAKFNAGRGLDYSTYLSEARRDIGFGIAVDGSGNAYVTGSTDSPDFPTASPFQAIKGLFSPDAFVTKVNPAGSALVYSTFLGGRDVDIGNGIAVDGSANAHVTGATNSTDFPVRGVSPLQATNAGVTNVFVTKLGSSGSAAFYSTYLGGSSRDVGFAIAVDASGNAYVTGQTASTDFPTVSPLQATNASGDAFVTKINPTGSALIYSTYLSGSSGDVGRGIAVDGSEQAYVTGETSSTDFPTVSPLQATNNAAGTTFVTKLGDANTPVGTSVAVAPVDSTTGTTPITVTFSQVTGAGTTSLTTSSAGPSPPAGFQLGTPPTYYDLTTTATLSGSVTVCITYTGVSFVDESALRLFHFDGGVWVDVTSTLDTVNDVICGSVTALSPFAILEPVPDTTPPRIQKVTPHPPVLWPPNHRLVPVEVRVRVTDDRDPAPVCQIASVTSDEPVDGLGDGDTAPDWEMVGDLQVKLRAERSGTGSGRVYTITVRCTDASGNASTVAATVTVPLNQGKAGR